MKKAYGYYILVSKIAFSRIMNSMKTVKPNISTFVWLVSWKSIGAFSLTLCLRWIKMMSPLLWSLLDVPTFMISPGCPHFYDLSCYMVIPLCPLSIGVLDKAGYSVNIHNYTCINYTTFWTDCILKMILTWLYLLSSRTLVDGWKTVATSIETEAELHK